jgi:hypothetical protein
MYGRSVGVRVNRDSVLELILGRLPAGWKASADSDVQRLYSLRTAGTAKSANIRYFHLLYQGIEQIGRSQNLEELLDALAADLRLYIAENAKGRVFVHAGVVGWRGRAILIPGRSFSGKSTLTAELVRAGATYYSDEYAVLDSRGRVHPFLKPLSLRNGGVDQTDISAEQLGGVTGDRPLPVGLVVVSAFKPAASWRPRALSAGQGALELLAHTVAARRQPERTLETLRKVAGRAPVVKGNRGEASVAAARILKWCDLHWNGRSAKGAIVRST